MWSFCAGVGDVDVDADAEVIESSRYSRDVSGEEGADRGVLVGAWTGSKTPRLEVVDCSMLRSWAALRVAMPPRAPDDARGLPSAA